MTNYVYGDQVGGDKIGGDKYQQSGHNNTFNVTHSSGVSGSEVDAAVAELRAFVAELTHSGVVAPDGTVTDPAAVVTAVESNKGRLKAVGRALSGGAKDAILSVVKEGVATLIVALVSRV